jgi:hypothetical protein
VTNYGTLEHVNNQYMGFKNTHDLCCIDGMIIHFFVAPKNWKGHGRYYYPIEFINKLAEYCEYSILFFKEIKLGRVDRTGNFVAYRKDKSDFISQDLFKIIPIIDTNDLRHTGNYKK